MVGRRRGRPNAAARRRRIDRRRHERGGPPISVATFGACSTSTGTSARFTHFPQRMRPLLRGLRSSSRTLPGATGTRIGCSKSASRIRFVGGRGGGLAGGRTVRATSTPLRSDDKRFVLRFLHVARVLRAKDFRRWQAVVRRAYPHLLALRGPWRGTIDDEYCAAWRMAMLAAGGTSTYWRCFSYCWSSQTPNAAHPSARTSLSALRSMSRVRRWWYASAGATTTWPWSFRTVRGFIDRSAPKLQRRYEQETDRNQHVQNLPSHSLSSCSSIPSSLASSPMFTRHAERPDDA